MGDVEQIIDEFIPKGIAVTQATQFPFQKPRYFYQIPREILDDVARYIKPVIEQATGTREVDVLGILINTQEMFKKIRHHDNYWVQHCAASFREILVFVDPVHFLSAYPSIPDPQNPNVAPAFTFFENACSYLSNVVHHQKSRLVGSADILYPSDRYGQMTKDSFLSRESEFLEKVCIDVVYTLRLLSSMYP